MWLGLVTGILFFLFLGTAPLANPDEGRYAEIAREMLVTGDWVLPHLNGIPYFEKPPLTYWLVAGAEVIFGPSEWSIRMIPALFGLGGVLATYAALRRLYGRFEGLFSAAVLATGLLYFAHSRLLVLDMGVSVLMSIALLCFILGVHEVPGARRRRLFYTLYAATALATLTKGLIGVLLPGAVMFLWLLIFNEWKRLRPFYLPTGGLLFLAIAAPWHILAAQRHDGWAHFYFIREHWERFATDEHKRQEPWWFFAPIILLGIFPWTGFLWQAVREAVAGGWARRKENAIAWFLIVWAVFVFLFFSKSQSKLIPYILSVFPPLSGLIGVWLARRVREGRSELMRAGLWIFTAVSLFLAVALIIVVNKQGLLRESGQMLALRPYAYAMAGILMIGAPCTLLLGCRYGPRASLVTILATMAAFFCALVPARVHIQKPGTKDIALVLNRQAGPNDVIYHYWGFFHDFTYYTGREVGLVEYVDELEVQFMPPEEKAARFIDRDELLRQWKGPVRVWLVAKKRDTPSLFGDPAFRYHLIAESHDHFLLSNQL